jgi:hypothetical protein
VIADATSASRERDSFQLFPHAASARSIAVRVGKRVPVVVQSDKEASQTRDYCAAKNAALRAARPDSSRRKERLFGMTISRELQLPVSG